MLTRAHLILLVLNTLYVLPFTFAFVRSGNYEFLGYVAQIVVLGILVALTLPRTRFPTWILALLSLWGCAHLAGGGLLLANGEVLYRYVFFEVWRAGEDVVLKFDQVVHLYGFFASTFAMWWLLVPQVKPEARAGVVAGVAALAGMGLGAVNEVVEFIAYALLPSTGVGGYVNTAIDLVANGLGAILAAVIIAHVLAPRYS